MIETHIGIPVSRSTVPTGTLVSSCTILLDQPAVFVSVDVQEKTSPVLFAAALQHAPHTMAVAAEDDYQSMLSAEQISELKAAFNLFDLDGGGDIDSEELGTVMRALGQNPSEDEIAAMIAEVDTEGTGSIEMEGFIRLMARKMLMEDVGKELEESFRIFSEEDDGFITLTALRTILQALASHLSSEEVNEIVELYDDGTSRISFDDFSSLMQGATRRI